MKPHSPFLLSLVLAPSFLAGHPQDVTRPIIPAPPPAAQAPQPTTPAPSQTPPQSPGQTPGQTTAKAAVPAPGSAASTPIVPANYVIGPRDSLSISVWKEPTVSANVEVRPDGMITLPLLGDVKATGFTPTQLADDITNRLKKDIIDPLVTVTVLGINSKFIFFTGDGMSHSMEMPYDPALSIVQAIIRAGGLGPYAKKTKIVIQRNVNGKVVLLPFNYKTALKTGNQQGISLLPGDIINVP